MEKSKVRQFLKLANQDTFLTANYQILDVVGEGCFGKIFKVKQKKTEQILALKIEKKSNKSNKMVLKNEIAILTRLQGKCGVPKIYKTGQWENGTFMEMELLDHDLNEGRNYSVTDIISLTLELLKIMKEVHDGQVVHQDLKPQNIMRNSKGYLFIIDYGLARINPRKGYSMKGFIGTPRYASLRAHNRLEQSKKDDLESLFYNIAYLYYQKLPWSSLSISSDKKMDKIKLLKEKHQDTLFHEMAMPFQLAFNYILSLKPLEQPNYRMLQGYFKRNKTIVLEPQIFTGQRSNTKRVSLNNSNFLQLPIPQFRQKSEKSIDQKWGFYSSRKSIASNSTGKFSNMVHNLSSMEIDDDIYKQEPEKIQIRTAHQWQDFENDWREENIEPELPSTAKSARSIVLKNPFR